jgi:hypothetical protein
VVPINQYKTDIYKSMIGMPPSAEAPHRLYGIFIKIGPFTYCPDERSGYLLANKLGIYSLKWVQSHGYGVDFGDIALPGAGALSASEWLRWESRPEKAMGLE